MCTAGLGGIVRTIVKYGHEKLNADNAETVKLTSKAEKELHSSKWKGTIAEEGVVAIDEEDDAVDDTAELSKLTGKPHVDDLILGAIPVCAPYQSLSQYTYRIKLTPGSMKRGKAAKQCVEIFLADDNSKSITDHARYKAVIKKVADNEWLQTICSDVKIAAPGASKATKKSKATGKKAKNK
jgi:hypothetical protein